MQDELFCCLKEKNKFPQDPGKMDAQNSFHFPQRERENKRDISLSVSQEPLKRFPKKRERELNEMLMTTVTIEAFLSLYVFHSLLG